MRNRNQSVVLAVLVAAGVFLCHRSSALTAPPVTDVWAVDMPTVANGDPYGNQSGPAGATENLEAMKRDGIDNVAAACFTSPSLLTSLMSAADRVGGIHVAPIVDLSILYRVRKEPSAVLVASAEQAISGYCTLGVAHGCAARTPDGRPIVWIFGARELTTAEWLTVAAKVRASGLSPFLIADGVEQGPWGGRWSFFAGRTDLVTTLMPQYTRAGRSLALVPDGGKRFVAQWESACASRTPAVLIVTWNDTGDGSEIAGNANLEQLTAEWSAKWRAK